MSEPYSIQEKKKLKHYQAENNHQTFIEMAEKYRDSLINVAYGFLHDKELAMDVVQDALLKAYQKIESFQNNSSLYTWIYRITANLCKDRIRQKKRRHEIGVEDMRNETYMFELPDLKENPRFCAENNEMEAIVTSAIETLPETHKQILILRESGGLSYKEIADVLQCQQGTVMSRLFHARKMLADRLKKLSGNLV